MRSRNDSTHRLSSSLPVSIALLAGALCLAGCGAPAQAPPGPGLSPNASPEIVQALRQDLETPRHPSDGAGSVRIVEGPGKVTAGTSGTWTFVFDAGPLGIAEGGWLFFQVSPFWNWSTPQVSEAYAPGFTEVSTSAAGVVLEAETLDRQLLGVRLSGRPMAAGETIRLTYGAGAGGARVDRFAEAGSQFWFAVDGDGDGVRGLLPEPATVDVTASTAAQLILTLPSVARPGEEVELRVAAVDVHGNQAVLPDAHLELSWERRDDSPAGDAGELPTSIALTAGPAPSVTRFEAPAGGVLAVRADAPEGLQGVSNPMLVSASRDRILWGDLHGHSNLSDGTGTPEQYFRYARDVAALDFVALTDHDHWGMQPLATHPGNWDEIKRQVSAFHDPGRFATLLGYEWTNWLHGHRHVLYFEDDGPVFSAVDPDYETPTQLWDALRPYPALTFAHHSAGAPVATNWNYAPDPDLEPITEIVSVHGSSEAADSPRVVHGAIPGNYVRDALERGYVLGFIGSGDGHDGHPGLSTLANPNGGLAAVPANDLSRESVRQALVARRAYATNGTRTVLAATLDGAAMGSKVAPAGAPVLAVEIAGTAPLARLDVIRNGRPPESIDLGGLWHAALELPLVPTGAGDFIYVRVLEEGGGTAWSSPFFVDSNPVAP